VICPLCLLIEHVKRRGGVMEYSSPRGLGPCVLDVILRAMSGEISWFAAADIL
jgi:hypothetical protein